MTTIAEMNKKHYGLLLGFGLFTLGIYGIIQSSGTGNMAWLGLATAIVGASVFNGIPTENELIQTITDTPRSVLLAAIAFTAMIVAREGIGVLANQFLFWGMGGLFFSIIVSGVMRDFIGNK